ncbi:MAG: phosphoribosylformylglycinamidine synthase subunit PurL [Peptococcaceae bacterium]|nr:phosphoribosylformylglycinamidine synthase subunit PurL [Peptococcaceae bacterium]
MHKLHLELQSLDSATAMGLKPQEYEKVIEIMGRVPNLVELGMFAVMWSEHCSYKHSRRALRQFPTTGARVLQGPGENAGVVDIGDDLALVFKIESHNHPSAIEPYQGAATGVGGIVRDVFAMGARPVALLNSLRFGELDSAHQRWLFSGVVAGIAGYGNCLGIPTVGGEIYFNQSYTGNCLVNAMCVGLIDHASLAKGKAAGVGNRVILIGASTGRDGIHGATFASEELSEQSAKKRPSVQVGDPFMEKLLLEACLELIKDKVIIGMQDLGAAGLTSSSSEMAARAGTGLELDVARVPRRESNMNPYEIMLSESQERMLLVVEPEKVSIVAERCAKWGLTATDVGQVTDDGLLRILDDGEVAAELSAAALASEGPVYSPVGAVPAWQESVRCLDYSTIKEPQDLSEVLVALLSTPNIASKEWVYRQYDHMVRGDTVILPGSDAAMLRIKGTQKGIAMSVDCNSRYVYLDPYTGGAIAVAEAARNVACSGAEPLAVTNCLNFGNPEKPEVFYQLNSAIQGMAAACNALNTPVTGGNVSLYNETKGQAIYPTPTVGMVGLIEDIEKRVTQGFKNEGDTVYLLGTTHDELGGSEYLKLRHGLEQGMPPQLNLQLEVHLQKLLVSAAKQGLLRSAHDCAEGGLAVTLSESAISGSKGVVIELINQGALRLDSLLFGESQSRVIVSVAPQDNAQFELLCGGHNVPCQTVGKVQGRSVVVRVDGQEVIAKTLGEIQKAWREAIPCLMSQ